MPLPVASIPWPPKQLEQITPVLRRWDAWWTGDPTALTSAYQAYSGVLLDRPSQHRGGVVGALARFWWGRPLADLSQHRDQTHVPLAADIARTSADLLFAEPPSITVKDAATQTRIEGALEEHLLATLTGAAEQGAALGGSWLRVVWDGDVADAAFVAPVTADHAVPEMVWGRLRAVTFWTVLDRDGSDVIRHLERHELIDGIGYVQHGLYLGTVTDLGRRLSLSEHQVTRGLVDAVDADGYITAGRTPGLGAVYVPNTEPSTSRAWRHIPSAAGLGAADIDGIEPLLDNLDEVHASWLRDLRLSKARLLVSREMLEDLGPGRGATFNLDTEIFSPLKIAPAENGTSPITPAQFAIRFAEHQATAEHWGTQIVRAAGYSQATFGEQGQSAQTATEVVARQSRTMLTRDRKIRAWRPALRTLVTKLLLTDAAVFQKHGDPTDLAVAFPDGISETQLQLAQTALALKSAGAASTRSLVALTHPDWTDLQVDEEAAKIGAEQPGAAADPYAFTG